MGKRIILSYIIVRDVVLLVVINGQVRSMVDSARPFVRWMDGTCLETPEQV
jgi:hypothetical protein